MESVSHMHLDEPEFFITFILNNFTKKSYIVVIVLVNFDAINQSCEPFNNQILEAIFLV